MKFLYLISLVIFLRTCDCVEGVVPLRINRVAANPHSNEKRASGGTVSDPAANKRYFYSSNVDIGTPAQRLQLLLDTGSSDTWVFGPSTHASRNNGGGTSLFDSTKSKTYKSNNSDWQIDYGIGHASGTWGHDKFSIAGAHLSSLSIGVANSVDQINQGIVGIGRKQAEITTKKGYTYDNLPYRMKAEGLIKTAAYSMFLDDLNSRQGTILFGGVDHSRYSGALVSRPIAHPKHLGITITAMHADGRATDNAITKPQVAVLDSGTSLSYVPQDVLINLHTALNANPSFTIGQKYYCDCNITEHLVLEFGPAKVSIPAYEFLWPIEELVSPSTAQFAFPENSCYVGIEPASSDQNFILLGDNMLRSMYVVYDLEHNQIAVAQGKSSSAQPQVQAITGSKIPGAR